MIGFVESFLGASRDFDNALGCGSLASLNLVQPWLVSLRVLA